MHLELSDGNTIVFDGIAFVPLFWVRLGKGKPFSIPYWMAWCIAKVGDLMGHKAPFNSYRLTKMTESLTFSNEKAKRELGWQPLDVLTNYTI